MEGHAAGGPGGSREGRHRPYWRSKAKPDDGHTDGEGGLPSSATAPENRALSANKEGAARRPRQQQEGGTEPRQGRDSGGGGSKGAGRVPRREVAAVQAAAAEPAMPRGPRLRQDGWGAEGVGPPPAPPPGLSQAGAARAFKQALPHPYRIGQSQAEAASAAAGSPSHRGGASSEVPGTDRMQQAAAPRGNRSRKSDKGTREKQQQGGEGGEATLASLRGGTPAVDQRPAAASRGQAGGKASSGGRGGGRGSCSNGTSAPGGRGARSGANGPPQPLSPAQRVQQAVRQAQQPFQQFQQCQQFQQGPQQQQQQQRGGGSGRRPIFSEYLPSEELQRGLKSGLLFRALFRCNAADRTQGFCSVAGLPSDVFIKGYKAQNRAIEGDEVVIRVLPPDQWYQLTSAKQVEEQAKQAQQEQAKQVQHAVPAVSSNVVPAAVLASRAAPAVPLQVAAAGAAEEEVASPPGWTEAAPPVGLGDLVATPALCSSGSGGDLAFALGPAPVDSDSEEEGSEAEEGLSDDEAERVLEEIEDQMQGMSLAGLVPAGTAHTAGEAPAGAVSAAAAVAPVQPAQQPAQQAPGAGAAQEGAQSMLDFVLAQPKSTAGVAGSCGTPPATPPAPAANDGEISCCHAAESAEESLQRVAEALRGQAGWRATGEVVAVVQPTRRRESVIGVLKQEGEGDTGILLLYPCDPRLPRMLVRSSQLPHSLKLKLKQEAACPELSSRMLVSAHVVGWECNHMFPLAQVRESLGQAGELASETRALLEMEQVLDDDQFTPPVLACLPPTPWSISEEELASRRDFRATRLFSIDPPTARDLDDALSVEDLGGGLYRVGVHIADVSHFVRPGTALDKEAQQRSTSVYLVDRVIPMLPRLLCEELCSLNPGVDRLAFSIVWDITEEGDIQSTWVGRSVIRSCGKLAYPMVQAMIEGSYLARPGEEPPCDLHGPHSWPEVVGDSLALHRIALNLRRRRFEGGALRLDNVRLYFKLDEEGNPQDYGVYEQKEANRLVEEFMLLANMTAARMVADAFPDRALLRCHPPPNQHKLGELASVAKDLGFQLDISSSGALQESLAVLRAATEGDYVMDIITLLATKPMQVARYFCTGETPDEAYWRHYALAVSHYTHFTSPIRRYPDIIVHRLLAAAIDSMGGPQARAERHGLLEARETGMVAAHANDRKLAAKSVQDGSLRLYLCVMLHRQPIVCDGVVMAVGGSRFFDVYVPCLGLDVRVHTNSVLKGADAAVTSTWDAQNKVLTLGRASNAPPEACTLDDLPDYAGDIPNFDRVQNPGGVVKAALPLTLRMLTHVPVVVSSRRSQISGSPTHVVAKLWLE